MRMLGDYMAHCYGVLNAVTTVLDHGGLLIADSPTLWPPGRAFPGCAATAYPSLAHDPAAFGRWLDSALGAASHIVVLHLSGATAAPPLPTTDKPVGYWSDAELVGERFANTSALAAWSERMAAL